jgi:hypothetical protein
MTDNNFILGNIIKVRWHTRLHKISNYNYGHMAETFDEDNMITEEIIDLSGVIVNTNPYITLNKNMNPDKNYAMITLDKCGNIFVRNFFDSKHPEGFKQKNSYFQDDIADKFMMSDENNVLLNYIKLGYAEVTTIKNIDNGHWLYFCVEYKINDGINHNLLNYCISLENKYRQLDNRLKDIEQKNYKDTENSNNKSKYFKFPFF